MHKGLTISQKATVHHHVSLIYLFLLAVAWNFICFHQTMKFFKQKFKSLFIECAFRFLGDD